MTRLQAFERHVRLLHVAAVLLCAQHQRSPEHAHFRQVLVPASRELLVEDGTEQRVGAHALVKRVDQFADVVLGGLGISHGKTVDSGGISGNFRLHIWNKSESREMRRRKRWNGAY